MLKCTKAAWSVIIAMAILLSSLGWNQNAQVICRYCALACVFTTNLPPLVLLAEAFYTASKVHTKRTGGMNAQLYAGGAIIAQILCAIVAIVWTGSLRELSLGPLLVSELACLSTSPTLITYSSSLA